MFNQLKRPQRACLALMTIIGFSQSLAYAAAPRPNIIVVLIDDLRWDGLACTGHPFATTPNIDHLAAEGAVFRNAFVTTPICLPSRATFLTGLYAHTHKVSFGGDRNDPGDKLPTFPRLLQSAGYDTAFIGKWHIGLVASPRPGFDHWISFEGQGEYVNPSLNVDGEQIKETGYLTDILTDRALQYIDRSRTKPFFLYLAHKGVHAPFIPAERHQHQFEERSIVRAESAKDKLDGKPVLKRPGVALRPGNDPDVVTTDEMIRGQMQCMTSIDEGLGRILEQLRTTDQLDNTVIFFTSDNGYFWGEHGLGGKHGPYEEAIRIPLIVRYPPLIKPGAVLDQLVLSVDLAPTVLQLAGVPIPKDLHGRSLLPLLESKGTEWRTSIFAEYLYNVGQTPRFPTWRAVRTNRWKYIYYPDFVDMEELYDLSSDPLEIKNLVSDPSASSILAELRSELQRLMQVTNYVEPAKPK